MITGHQFICCNLSRIYSIPNAVTLYPHERVRSLTEFYSIDEDSALYTMQFSPEKIFFFKKKKKVLQLERAEVQIILREVTKKRKSYC